MLAALDAGEFPSGASLPAERTLALRLAVSRVTVRAALARLEHRGVIGPNPHGRGRVVRARADGEATHPLVTRSVVVLSLLGQHGNADAPPWYLRTDAALVRDLHQRGWFALTVGAERFDRAQCELIARSRPRGAVIGTGGEGAEGLALARALSSAGVRVVTTSDDPAWDGFDRVLFDHEAGGELLAESLIARGCRRLLPIAQADPPGGRQPWWLERRLAGIGRALARHGLPRLAPVEMPFVPDGIEDPARHDLRVRHCVGYLVDRIRPDGEPVDCVLALSDGDVFPLTGACRLLGITPRIAGYDNYWSQSAARAWEAMPPLATIDRGDAELGRALSETLFAPPSPPLRRLIAPRLVIPA